MRNHFENDAEWLEADGLGGFASGTVSGQRTRRYHALLLAATTPPTGRLVLVNGFDAWIEVDNAAFPLSSQHYSPDVVDPDGHRRIESFEPEPWPRWTYRLENGLVVEQELFVPHEQSAVAIRWRIVERPKPLKSSDVMLHVRPFLSGRDYHSMHHENSAFQFDADVSGECVRWSPYTSVPTVAAWSNGQYCHEPLWYRNFSYQEEAARGLDCTEDLASPGVFHWKLNQGDAVWILSADGLSHSLHPSSGSTSAVYTKLAKSELRRRKAFPSPLERAADAYVVRRGDGRTIVAGYPWFTDWGRDTFIAMRGLCIATSRLDVAREILLAWSAVVSEGMLPNRFPDHGDSAEFNSVDASLWYIIAVHDYLKAAAESGKKLTRDDQQALANAVEAILDGYARGTRYRIRVDDDGLLAAGEPGVQLTWMDAKVGGWVVTPRIGKPVEVQALWLNALAIAANLLPNAKRWQELFDRGRATFSDRYWNADTGCLFDVVDVDHEAGRADASVRPNQILAVGGLPVSLVESAEAKKVVDLVEQTLWTPLGLRSLSPDDPLYRPRYEGDVWERDGAYHQGTVWPWLIGPFVEAWVRVRDNTAEAKREAQRRFIEPLLAHLEVAGIGHISEIADAEPPHTPRGCPFQAWSLGELLRLTNTVLREEKPPHPRRSAKRAPTR